MNKLVSELSRIKELEKKIDNLGLAGAFLGRDGNVEAKRQIDRMIKDIDRCIKLMEGQ